MSTNPYIPIMTEGGTPRRRWIRVMFVTSALLYPLLVLVCLYSTWGLATLQIGRPPIPYLEYPDGFAITIMSWLTAVLYLCAPIAVPIGLVVSTLFPFSRDNTRSTSATLRLASVVTYVAICVVVFIILVRDPYRVADWFWD